MENVDGYSIVLTTTATKHDARELASQLLEEGLMACAQIIPIDTVFRRDGEVTTEGEFLVLIKTREDLYPELERHVVKEYDHNNPEVFALPLTAGNAEQFGFIERHLLDRREAGARAG